MYRICNEEKAADIFTEPKEFPNRCRGNGRVLANLALEFG